MPPETLERSREQRLRRAATRQGLRLVKPRRHAEAIDSGRYYVVDSDLNWVVAGLTGSIAVFDLDDVERYLADE